MKRHFLLLSIFLLISMLAKAQEKSVTDSIKAHEEKESFRVDTLAKQELSPLDIAEDRGIFIYTKDGKMQLRILGSIRFSLQYDFVDFPVKSSLNSYYVPIGDANVFLPNFYNGLNQTRIGFEVTRKLEDRNVFIRLETDFNGANGAYRIRHAYGQINNFLVGKTWSLFSNVSSLPATVDGDGPTGSVSLRTAQIRYSGSNKKGTRWAAAFEYSRPDFNAQSIDTAGFSVVQLLPDITARIEREGVLGAVQLSGVLTTLSIRNDDYKLSNLLGFGGSLSGTVDFTTEHKLLYQITYGKSISHFINTFSGTGMDAIFNSATDQIEPIWSFGGFLAYGFDWTTKISSTISGGYANLSGDSSQSNEMYRESMSAFYDMFWNISDGARLGVEYGYAHRWNTDGRNDGASRISALFYYDF